MTFPQIDLWLCAPSGDADAGRSFAAPGGGSHLVSSAASGDLGSSSQRPLDDLEDTERIRRVNGSDTDAARAAFEALYREHAPGLARFVYGYLRTRTAAEDVVADVFLSIWARRTEWAPRYGIRAYLYSAGRHRALNVRRGEGRLTSRLQALAADVQASGDSLSDATRDAPDLRTRLDAALAALPEDARRLAELRWRDGMSAPEIAAILGINRAAVDNRLTRLVKRLRALVG